MCACLSVFFYTRRESLRVCRGCVFECACFGVHPSAYDSAAVCSGMMERSMKSDHTPKADTLPTQGDEDECVG